ncbi:MAG: HAD hydrolase-like protein, partial [Phycisphaerae bacterium]|nr:HAD hydrolase-like protein [Phycisphaerae bacterium]
MIYQAVIFDLDGTLVNTLADIAVSANHAMTQLSLPTHPIESFRQKIGHGIRHMVS